MRWAALGVESGEMGVDRVMNATPPCKAVTPVACDYVLTTEEDEEDLFVDEAARSFPSTPATVAQKGRSPSPSDSEFQTKTSSPITSCSTRPASTSPSTRRSSRAKRAVRLRL